MKKLYLTLLLILGALLLAIGVWSAVGLSGAPLPAFGTQSLADRSLFDAIETAQAERFPLRSWLLARNKTLNGFYYFSLGGEQNLLAIDYAGGAEEGGERLEDLQVQEPEQKLPEVALPDEADVQAVGTVIINGNRAMDIPTADPEILPEYSAAVNRIATAMPEGTRTFVLVTPNGGQFYHSGEHDQKAMIDTCYARMDASVTPVDAYSELARHIDEYLFFRTDHHWTQKGAYYAYCAFCDAAGFTPSPLDSYQTGEYESFVGSMYNYTSAYPQSEALKKQPDTLVYYLPKAHTSAVYYADAALTGGIPVPVVDIALREEVSNKYLCYLGGDTPICVIETDAAGGTCMVLKESFGNAFVPFLAEHYSRIVTLHTCHVGARKLAHYHQIC